MIGFFRRRHMPTRAIDPEGQRLIGLTLDTNEPLFAPRGSGMLLSAIGGGKTTRGAVPWVTSLAADLSAAQLVVDSKDGEIAAQCCKMLSDMGRKVVVIDEIRIRPELEPWRIELNPFGGVVAAHKRDPRDVIFANENITQALIPEPQGDTKNKPFRDSPRDLIEFANNALLKRNTDLVTPGGAASILSDSDMLLSFAKIEAEEGDPDIKAQARGVIDMREDRNWGLHLNEARKSLKIFGPGTRLFEVGREATATHAGLIEDKAIIFLIGPQSYMTRLGNFYALHILAFTDALYHGAGQLRIIADEYTNTPIKPLISQMTTLRAYGCEIYFIAQSRSESIRKFGEQETRTLEENCITKQWFGFSSFEEAERISKAMGEEFALSSTLGGDSTGDKTQTNLSLAKQRIYTPSELMQMPPDQQLIHIKGIGFFMARTVSQNQIASYCHLFADNPLEGSRLPPDPKVRLQTPNGE